MNFYLKKFYLECCNTKDGVLLKKLYYKIIQISNINRTIKILPRGGLEVVVGCKVATNSARQTNIIGAIISATKPLKLRFTR